MFIHGVIKNSQFFFLYRHKNIVKESFKLILLCAPSFYFTLIHGLKK